MLQFLFDLNHAGVHVPIVWTIEVNMPYFCVFGPCSLRKTHNMRYVPGSPFTQKYLKKLQGTSQKLESL